MPAPTRCLVGCSRVGTTPELPPLIVVGGATATGKTRLAIEMARTLGDAEIVSADSRQVYRGMDIGTAKATAAERAAVPHHGLDLVDPDATFSAADYKRAATEALRSIAERGHVALLVGGTGLYLRAVARGLPLDRDDHDPSVRAELDERLRTDGLERLVSELAAADPDALEAIDTDNPRRVIRALERVRIGGTAHQPEPEGYPAPIAWLGLALDPRAHRDAIVGRVARQFDEGLLEEAERLRARYPEDLRAFSAMGYREAFDVLAGRSSTAEAIERDAQRTWAYARRQRTWFRAEPDIAWIEGGEGATAAALATLPPFLGAIRAPGYAGSR